MLINEQGEYFSPRSGICSPDFNPFAHLFRSLKSAKNNKTGYGNLNLKIIEVEIGIISSKKYDL